MTRSARSDAPDPSGQAALAGFAAHDHDGCVRDAVAVAERRCAEAGLRFTPVRRAALEALLSEHRALGAYQVLERLQAAGFGSQPPVAYRALDFLVTHGLAHRIERLNAFVACAHPGKGHLPVFMICRVCESVAEARAAPSHGTLGREARAAGFVIERAVVEAEGVCPGCADAA